jgi:hypothetical protein
VQEGFHEEKLGEDTLLGAVTGNPGHLYLLSPRSLFAQMIYLFGESAASGEEKATVMIPETMAADGGGDERCDQCMFGHVA